MARARDEIAPPRRWRPGLLAAVTVVAAASLLGPLLRLGPSTGPETTFQVYDHARDSVVYERGLSVGDEIMLEHVHSVTKRSVRETFSVLVADTIALEELWFDTFGANLPAGPEETGDTTTTFIHEDGAYRVLHHSKPLGVVPLRVGSPEVDHTVTFEDGSELRLLDVAGWGAHVELRVRSGR